MSEEARRLERGRGARRQRRLTAAVATVALHSLVLVAVLQDWSGEPLPAPPPIEVMLVPPPPPRPPLKPAPKPEPEPEAPAAAGPKTPEPPKRAAVKPPPVPRRVLKELAPSETPPRLVPPDPVPTITEVSVSAAELASATTAESEGAGGGGGSGDGLGGPGGGGGRCDMVARLQRALRNDPGVRRALAGARRAPGFEGRPLMVWNGDWVRHGAEEGKGLASLRQAIAVEVAFAPKACRSQAMRGLVLLSLTDSPGTSRVVLGTGAWRWSDLALR